MPQCVTQKSQSHRRLARFNMTNFGAFGMGRVGQGDPEDDEDEENAFSAAKNGTMILGTTITTVNEGTPLLTMTTTTDTTNISSTRPPSSSNDSNNNLETSSLRTVLVLPGMQLRSHSIDAQAKVRWLASTKEALSGARSRRGHYWIDIDADVSRDREELRDWLEQLRCIPPFFVAQLAEPTWFSEVVALRGCVLAVIRILPVVVSRSSSSSQDSCCSDGSNGGAKSNSVVAAVDPFQLSDESGAVHLAALTIGKNLLLTFTSGPKTDFAGLYDAVTRYMRERERLPDASSSGCLVAWLHFHLDRTSRLTRELASYVASMDESMDRNIKSVTLEEIVQLKDKLLRLLSVAEEQQESIESLTGVEPDTDSLDFQRLRGALSVLLSKTSATQRMALRLEKHIAELRSRLENHQQERINRRLAVLTVLSAIFLPLTLITGVWGMSMLSCITFSCAEEKSLSMSPLFVHVQILKICRNFKRLKLIRKRSCSCARWRRLFSISFIETAGLTDPQKHSFCPLKHVGDACSRVYRIFHPFGCLSQ